MADKDKDGLQDKNDALELLRDEASALGMTAFGRFGEEKLQAAIDEFKESSIEEDVKPEVKAPQVDFWKAM